MLTLIVLWTAGCGFLPSMSERPTRGDATSEPERPILNCPEDTTLESGSSGKGVEHWCERAGGVMHGPYILHHPNGEKAISGSYDKNMPHGAWTWWYDNAQQSKKGKYSHNKETGAWTWWHKNGNRMKEGDYLQGRRQGQWTTFYPSGMKESEGMYQNDRRNGIWTFYNDNEENSIAKTERYENDEMVEEKIIDDQRSRP